MGIRKVDTATRRTELELGGRRASHRSSDQPSVWWSARHVKMSKHQLIEIP